MSSLAGVHAGQNPCCPTSATSSALHRGTWPEAVTLRTCHVSLGCSSVRHARQVVVAPRFTRPLGPSPLRQTC